MEFMKLSEIKKKQQRLRANLRKKTCEFESYKNKIERQINSLEQTYKMSIVENKLYCPMEKLKEFVGKKIKSIYLVDKYGNITAYGSKYENINITESGDLSIDDLEEYITIFYFQHTKKYLYKYYDSNKGEDIESLDDDIIGFVNLELETGIIQETLFENISKDY